jgi:hypothetical protein
MNVILSVNLMGLAFEKQSTKPSHWGHISRIL